MVDNVKVSPSTRTTSVSIATDEINDIHYPIYKVAIGADGTVTFIDSDNPMPVLSASADVVRNSLLQESIDKVEVQLRILNRYNAKGFNETITEEDLDECD